MQWTNLVKLGYFPFCFLTIKGYILQAGGELTDFIIILRTNDAVKTFSSNAHLSFGAGLSAAVGSVGRAAEANLRVGDGGCAACYTYSCSKGKWIHFSCVFVLVGLPLYHVDQ